MESQERKELQSRREFFKKAAKASLPFLGVIALSATPIIARAKEAVPTLDCDGWCSNGCLGGCTGGCQASCEGSCTGCKEGCLGSCRTGCTGCSGGCTGVCQGCGGRCSHQAV